MKTRSNLPGNAGLRAKPDEKTDRLLDMPSTALHDSAMLLTWKSTEIVGGKAYDMNSDTFSDEFNVFI